MKFGKIYCIVFLIFSLSIVDRARAQFDPLEKALRNLEFQVEKFGEKSTNLLPVLHKIERLDSNHFAPAYLCSKIYFHQKKYSKALPYFRLLLDKYPDDFKGEYYQMYLQTLEYFNRYDDCLKIAYTMLAKEYDDSILTVTDKVKYYIEKNKSFKSSQDSIRFIQFISEQNDSNTNGLVSFPLNQDFVILNKRSDGAGEKFYISESKEDSFSLPKQFLEYMEGSENTAYVSPSGHYVVYTKCMSRVWDGIGGGCDIYYTSDFGNGWSEPKKMRSTINTGAFEGQASLSPTEDIMFFVSNKPGGVGGKDIWFSKYLDGKWQNPVNAGAVNTAFDEESPYLSNDGYTFYFVSQGHHSSRDRDIFKCIWDGEKFSQVTQLDSPINSSSDEFSCFPFPNSNDIIVTSNRAKSKKNDWDNWIFKQEHMASFLQKKCFVNGQVLHLVSMRPVMSSLDRNTEIQLAAKSIIPNQSNGYFQFFDEERNPTISIDLKVIGQNYYSKIALPVKVSQMANTFNCNLLLNTEKIPKQDNDAEEEYFNDYID